MADCRIDQFAQGVWFIRASAVLFLAAMTQHSGIVHTKKEKDTPQAEVVNIAEAEVIPTEPAAPPVTDAENQILVQAPIRFERGTALGVARSQGAPATMGMIAGTTLRERHPVAKPRRTRAPSRSIVVKMPKEGLEHVNF